MPQLRASEHRAAGEQMRDQLLPRMPAGYAVEELRGALHRFHKVVLSDM